MNASSRRAVRRSCHLAAGALLMITSGCVTADGARSAPATGPPAGVEVSLDTGRVRGADDGDVLRFRGIPYARPPVGELRWQPPRPMPGWAGVRDAVTSGPACPQAGPNPSESSEEEDCLTVDVTVPKKRSGEARPVMVWLHGGGFTAGAGSEYDPRRLAAQGDVVVVTVEFRLGILGYLDLPGMTDAGTYGLQDQQAALRWVRRNAAAFGGDAGDVTLFGESGGGIAVCGQLTSPAAAGLFAKAVMQSGSCAMVLLPNVAGPGGARLRFWRPRQESFTATRTAARRLGCPAGRGDAATLGCLRRQKVGDLLKHTGLFGAASVGGRTLPVDPMEALEGGSFHRVPVLSGHTRDEALLFAGVFGFLGQPITDENLHGLLVQGFGDRTAEVERRYPRRAHRTAAETWAAVHTDAVVACPQARVNDLLSRRTGVYAYEFADGTAPPFMPPPPGFPPGASHASELAYLFEVRDKPISSDGRPVPLTAAQRAVGADMVAAWSAFARDGVPGKSASWPRWSPGAAKAHLFTEKAGSTATSAPAAERGCAFWHRVASSGT